MVPARSSARSATPRLACALVRRGRHARDGTSRLVGFLGNAARALKLSGEITLLLTGDAEVRRLNARYRGIDRATDVLAFSMETRRRRRAAGDPPAACGDIVISLDAAARQAREFGHPLDTEVRILALHGLVHLAGYDHHGDGGRMRRIEERLRRRYELPVGLVARAASPQSAGGEFADAEDPG